MMDMRSPRYRRMASSMDARTLRRFRRLARRSKAKVRQALKDFVGFPVNEDTRCLIIERVLETTMADPLLTEFALRYQTQASPLNIHSRPLEDGGLEVTISRTCTESAP